MTRSLLASSCIATLLGLSPVAGPVFAGPLDEVVQIDVLPGWRTDAGTQMAAIRLTLAPGWKTYWRAPGEGGIPPEFSWRGSQNVSGLQFHWPVPEVSDQGGMRSYVYHDTVVIPVELTLDSAGQMTVLAGSVDLGVCDEICLPVTLDFAATLPEAGARDGAIVAALVNRPLTEAEAGVGAVTCSVTPMEQGILVTARMTLPSAGGEEAVVIEASDPQIWVSPTETMRAGGVLTASAQMIHVSGAGFALDRGAVRFTVLGRDHAVDITGCTAG